MTGGRARCELCGDTPHLDELLDHLRVTHPDTYGDGPDRWPDGAPVIIDTDPSTGDLTASDEGDTSA